MANHRQGLPSSLVSIHQSSKRITEQPNPNQQYIN